MNKGYILVGNGFYSDHKVLFGAYRVNLNKEDKVPIAGLSDIRRPPRLGKLRLGIKKKKTVTKNGKPVEIEYPAEVDYFILDPETPDQAQRDSMIAKFHEAFGDKPKRIEIKLMSTDLNDVFPQNYTRFGKSSSLKCIGDGETATPMDDEWQKGLVDTGLIDKENGRKKYKCLGKACVYSVSNDTSKVKECSASATLSVIIDKLPGMGVWQVTTGSFYSIVNINSCIEWITLHYRDKARMMPLVLERRPQETPYKGKKTTHYILHINAEGYMQTTEPPPELPPPDTELVETVAAVGAGKGTEENPIDLSGEKVEVLPEKVNEAESQQEFVDGLKEDNKEEYGEPGKYVLPAEAKELAFWEFMPKARAKLKAAGLEKAYIDALHTYSVEVLSDLKGDDKRQEEVRVLVEAEMEDRGVKW